MENETGIAYGTTNVFADLGFAESETHMLNARLVTQIQTLLSEQGLNQMEAAKRMELGPDVCRILRGHFRDVSVERLMRIVSALGGDVRSHRQS